MPNTVNSQSFDLSVRPSTISSNSLLAVSSFSTNGLFRSSTCSPLSLLYNIFTWSARRRLCDIHGRRRDQWRYRTCTIVSCRAVSAATPATDPASGDEMSGVQVVELIKHQALASSIQRQASSNMHPTTSIHRPAPSTSTIDQHHRAASSINQ